ELLLARRQTPLAEISSHEVVSVKATDTTEHAAQELGHYDLAALPVVDDDNRLVGIITHDDILDVIVEEATEDAHMMGAVSPLEEGYLDASFLELWRKRAVWLACLFVAELFTFTALSFFEDSIAKVVVL